MPWVVGRDPKLDSDHVHPLYPASSPALEEFLKKLQILFLNLSYMYRPHPYAGYGPPQTRRTDSPPGPGPDRTRPAERGYGRGRGAGSLRRGGGAPGAMSSFTSTYESPYPGPALDNPYAEDAYNFRNGVRDEYNQFESHSGTLLLLPKVLATRYHIGAILWKSSERRQSREKLLWARTNS